MNDDLVDPFTGLPVHRDPQLPAWRKKEPAEVERGVVNYAVRAQKFILDPGIRYEPGAGEAAEADRPPIIKP